ncbi:MAG: phosphotransferase family protein [Anaerolineales bacterium]
MGDPALERLAEFLGRQYPEIENLKVLNLSEFGEGWETDLYRLKLMGTRNGKPSPVELVLRLYKGSNPPEKARKEFTLMTGATRFGVATPRVDALVTDRSILDAPFIVMEHIQGGTLEADINRSGVSQWLDPMMQVMVRIHAIPWKELIPEPERPRPKPDEPLAFVEGLLREMDQTIDRYGLTDFGPTMGWLHEREALGAATAPALVHNDYHPQNILLRDDEMVIIDWSFAEISDYRMDLAWSVLLLGVMAGQEHRSALLEAYEHAAGSSVENFEYFEALKFTMRMLTIATWLDAAVEIPVPRITKQAIRGDYKVHVLNPYRRLKEITRLGIRTIEEL